MDETFDQVVVGAGLRGLGQGLRLRRDHPGERLLLVDMAAQPGGLLRTQRSNGFVCELGPFAFARPEVEPLLALLPNAPPVVDLEPAAWQGHLFDGARLQELAVEPRPVSFATGNEELVQACRRALGPALRLGRQVTAVHGSDAGWEVTLGGEAPSVLTTTRLTLAVPVRAASALLGHLDRALPACAARLDAEPRAFAFLGGAGDPAELRGYGIVPANGLDAPVAEFLFCSQAFAGRALPGRFLVRGELAGPVLAGSDDAVLAAAEAELRRWTGTSAPVGFRKLHRFTADVANGAHVECRMRLHELAARAAGLTLA